MSANVQRRRIRAEWKRWDRICRRYRGFIRDCKAQEQLHGTKWADGMVRHYSTLLDRVASSEPAKYE
jgi:hypothetical protein